MARFTVLSPVRVGGKTVKPADDGSAVVELSERDARDLLKLGAVEPAPVVAPPAPRVPAPPKPPAPKRPKAPKPATQAAPAAPPPPAPDAPTVPEAPAGPPEGSAPETGGEGAQ